MLAGAALLTPASMALSGPVTVSIGANFPGTTLLDEFGMVSHSWPPDTMGAVGKSHFAELINGAYAVYDKTGVLQTRISQNAFWNTALANSGLPQGVVSFDPRILYDRHSERWFAIAVSDSKSTNSRLLIGVTTGDDPSPSNWHGFTFDPDLDNTRWADFPMLGINGEGIFISVNMFDIPDDGSTAGPAVTIVEVPKSDLVPVAGLPNIDNAVFQRNISAVSTPHNLQPAVDMDNGNLPLPGLISDTPNGNLKLRDFDQTTTGTTLILKSHPQLPVATRNGPPDARQPNDPDIDTGNPNFSGNVILTGGTLWAVHAVEVGGRAAIKWYQINPQTDDETQTGDVLQSGLIADPDMDYYYPSIAVNDFGHVAIGFSGSSDTQYASSYAVMGDWTTAPVANPFLTDFTDPVLLKAGVDDYFRLAGTRNRWGDYSATTVDPENDLKFWTIQEWASTASFGDNWSTQITELGFVPLSIPFSAGGSDECVITDNAYLSSECAYGALIAQDYGGPQAASLADIRLFDIRNLQFIGPDPTSVGSTQVSTFSAQISGSLIWGLDEFVLPSVPAEVTTLVTLTGIDGNSTIYENEMRNLFIDLRGIAGLPFDAWIDLDPATVVSGRTIVNEFDLGQFHVPSFFDLRTRLHVDFDRDGTADEILVADDFSRLISHTTMVPEPSCIILAALGFIGMLTWGCRWSKFA